MWSDREKMDLAGNAFAGPCSFAFLTALMAFAPLALAFSEEVKTLCVDGQRAGEGDEGDAEGGESESAGGDDIESSPTLSVDSESAFDHNIE